MAANPQGGQIHKLGKVFVFAPALMWSAVRNKLHARGTLWRGTQTCIGSPRTAVMGPLGDAPAVTATQYTANPAKTPLLPRITRNLLHDRSFNMTIQETLHVNQDHSLKAHEAAT